MTALVEIVADGGGSLGYGHVGRCLALADEFGDRCAFVLDDEDAERFVRGYGARAGGAPDAPVVLLDRRAPVSAEAVAALHAQGRRVALLDDLGAARATADLVVDPPTAATWPPAGGTRLSGFEHVLVRREIREAATAPRVPDGPVLLGMGGSDPALLTPPLAAALTDAKLPVRVALGPGYRGPRDVAGEQLPSPSAWPAALRGASVCVAGYGHSLVEAAHLGVPAIAVVFLEEHLPHARAFCEHGTAELLDMTGGPRPADLVDVVRALRDDPLRREAIAERGQSLVDGHGAARVAAALEALVTERTAA